MLYIPLLPVYVYGALRTRRLLYFTAANPGIEMGGFFGEKKDQKRYSRKRALEKLSPGGFLRH